MSQTSPSTVLVKKVPTLGQNEENIVYVCHCTIAKKKTYSQSTMKVYGVRTLMQHITFACVNIELPNQKIVCLRSKTYFILTKQLSSSIYNSLERYNS